MGCSERWARIALTGLISIREDKLKYTKCLFNMVFASAVFLGFAGLQAADAQQEYVTKARVMTLHQAPLPGVEGKEMIVKHFSIPPEFVGGRHMHPGPVWVYVLEGVLTVELDGETKTFSAGELYPEDIDAAMTGRNLSGTDDLEMLVFQIGDIGKPLMYKVE